MYTVNVIGCGKVGKTLSVLIQQRRAGAIQDLYSITPESAWATAKLIGHGNVVTDIQEMRPADIWLISVSDSQLRTVSESLARSPGVHLNNGQASIAFHCSGFESSEILSALDHAGFRVASMHPVMSFADPSISINQFAGTPCGIEGHESAVRVLDDLAKKIGGKPFRLSTQNKGLYHAAAVFCSNFNVVLQAIAQEAWTAAGVDANMVKELQTALLTATTRNTIEMGPSGALTGPASRGDRELVDLQHRVVQEWHPEAGEAYSLMSDMAWRLARTGQTK